MTDTLTGAVRWGARSGFLPGAEVLWTSADGCTCMPGGAIGCSVRQSPRVGANMRPAWGVHAMRSVHVARSADDGVDAPPGTLGEAASARADAPQMRVMQVQQKGTRWAWARASATCGGASPNATSLDSEIATAEQPNAAPAATLAAVPLNSHRFM
jgi:hypothetical protein